MHHTLFFGEKKRNILNKKDTKTEGIKPDPGTTDPTNPRTGTKLCLKKIREANIRMNQKGFFFFFLRGE